MIRNKDFTYWIILLPIVAIILTSTILTYKFISYEQYEFEKESKKLEEVYTAELKNTIKNRINRIINLAETNIAISKEEEKQNIKNIVNIGYNTIEETYYQNINLPKKQIISKIKQRLKNLKFYDNGSGYFFIIGFNNQVLMQPQTPSHEGRILTNLKDKNGKFFIQSFTNIAKTKGEGFDTWSWYKPKINEIKEKIGYIKSFPKLNLYIGTAKYIEDIDIKIKKDILKILNIIRYTKNEYVFVMNNKGTTLAHINKDFIGKSLDSVSQVEKKIVTNILQKAQNKNGDFIYYTPTSFNVDKNLSKKISFVKTIPSLNWIIGTGQYTTKIKQTIELKRKELKEELKSTINDILIISILISLVLILILTYIAKQIQRRLSRYEEELSIKNYTLKELNENLEKKVEEQVIKNRQKDEILHQQSKLASMGEMIGNIAHQWRQPLSAISTAASGIKLQNELKVLNSETMNYSLDTIVQNTQTLSQTIDDFRNFFKKDKTRTFFNINDTIDKVLNLLSASLKNKEIIIIKNIEDSNLYNLENELTQALLNILSNSKDALEKVPEDRRYIFIDSFTKDKKLHIKIKDSGNGIDEKIIDKIFEPYFTTKFNSQGIGIGLYMTQTIVVKHMKGQLKVSNEQIIQDKKQLQGAQFEIILDI